MLNSATATREPASTAAGAGAAQHGHTPGARLISPLESSQSYLGYQQPIGQRASGQLSRSGITAGRQQPGARHDAPATPNLCPRRARARWCSCWLSSVALRCGAAHEAAAGERAPAFGYVATTLRASRRMPEGGMTGARAQMTWTSLVKARAQNAWPTASQWCQNVKTPA